MSSTAVLFPGQGSQNVGMGKAAYDASETARAAFQEVDEALGFELSELCFSGDEQELARTENTQPAILVVSVALWRMLAERGLEADRLAGHSLGEYSALVAAGSLELGDAAVLVRKRGRFMQEAVAEGVGAMAAVLGLEHDRVEEACRDARAEGAGVVEPANYNAPGQVVIAGHAEAVRMTVALAKERGARRAMMLNVSAPFHCSLMAPAQDRLAAELTEIEIKPAAVPVICNVESVELTDPEEIREALRNQVTSTVGWVENLNTLHETGARRYIEVGPGRVLSGLVKRTLENVEILSVQAPDDMNAVFEALEA